MVQTISKLGYIASRIDESQVVALLDLWNRSEEKDVTSFLIYCTIRLQTCYFTIDDIGLFVLHRAGEKWTHGSAMSHEFSVAMKAEEETRKRGWSQDLSSINAYLL